MKSPTKTIHDLLAELGSELTSFTVSQIAEKTGKSERSIRTHLTRNGISVKDYDGEGKRTQALKIQEAAPKVYESEKSNLNKSLTNPYETYSKIQKSQNDGFNIMAFVCGLIWIVITIWGFSANGPAFFLFWLLISFGLFMVWGMTGASMAATDESRRITNLSPEERDGYNTLKSNIDRSREERIAVYRQETRYGSKNSNLICPHCQTKGEVRSKLAEEVSTTKVIPIIGNNIKTKKQVNQMHCDNCQTTWNV